MNTFQASEKLRKASINEAIRIIGEYARPEDVHELICATACAVRNADRAMSALLIAWAEEIDPTPALGDDGHPSYDEQNPQYLRDLAKQQIRCDDRGLFV